MFYTYLWLREDDSPYYVGKGTGRRAFSNHKSHRVFKPKSNERIVLQYWEDEGTAFAYEMYLIDFWGRIDLGTGILHNKTHGGEGPSGQIMSKETREKMSEVSKGKPKSMAHCENISKGKMGHSVAPEVRERLRETSKGNGNAKGKRSEESKKNMREARIGRKLSEAHKLNIREAARRAWAQKKRKLEK